MAASTTVACCTRWRSFIAFGAPPPDVLVERPPARPRLISVKSGGLTFRERARSPAPPEIRRCSLLRMGHPHQIMRIDIVELEPRLLVQHVGVDPVGAQQRNALFALGALLLEPRKLRGQRDDLLVELLLRVEAVAAGI